MDEHTHTCPYCGDTWDCDTPDYCQDDTETPCADCYQTPEPFDAMGSPWQEGAQIFGPGHLDPGPPPDDEEPNPEP